MFKAAAPSVACRTVCPRKPRYSASISRPSEKSSTIRMYGFGTGTDILAHDTVFCYLPKSSLDQQLSRHPSRIARPLRPVDLRGGDRPIEQHDHRPSRRLRVLHAGRPGPLEEPVGEPVALIAGDGARRVRRVGELADRVLERAAAKVLRLGPLHHPVEKSQGALRRRRVGEIRLDLGARVDGSALEAGRHQLVCAPEVLIERRLRRVGFGQHAIDADRANTFAVEQPIGGVEEAVANARLGRLRRFCPVSSDPARHLLTVQTDRSIVNGVSRQTGLFYCTAGRFSFVSRGETVRSSAMGYPLSGKTALVTGANRGIGEALVDALVAAGATKVYAAARSMSALAPLVARHGARVVPLQLDITNAAQIAAAAATASDLNLLVNNAGIVGYFGGDFTDPKWIEGGRREMEVNYLGTYAVTQAFAPVLARNGGGAVANLNSVVSFASVPLLAAYSASKAATHSLTQTTRAMLREQGTQVFGVYPGPIDTRMVEGLPLEKTSAADAARAIVAGIIAGTEEIFPDAVSQGAGPAFLADPKGLERQVAAAPIAA